jgi:putative Holliday junction resolvase
MDGGEQEMTRAARRFCRQLEGRYRLAVHRVDERLTSYMVESTLSETGELRQDIDPLAARLILEDWLQRKESQQ